MWHTCIKHVYWWMFFGTAMMVRARVGLLAPQHSECSFLCVEPSCEQLCNYVTIVRSFQWKTDAQETPEISQAESWSL